MNLVTKIRQRKLDSKQPPLDPFTIAASDEVRGSKYFRISEPLDMTKKLSKVQQESKRSAQRNKELQNPFSNQRSINENFVHDDLVVFDSSSDSDTDDRFAPSPIFDLDQKRGSRAMNRLHVARTSFFQRNDTFNADIMLLAGQAKTNRIKDKAQKESFGLFNIEAERNTFKKVNHLRYRENMFRAATRITDDLPMFPVWVYRDKPEDKLERVTFILGGTEYQSFEDTIVNIPNSKLATCVVEHTGEPIIFFDRDASCFNSVLNFYRTGRLHAPSSSCLSFFEEELEFWGINEEFMEPCCYSAYKAYKVACNTLKKFSESKDVGTVSSYQTTRFGRIKYMLHSAVNVGDKSILSQWYFTCYSMLIIISVLLVVCGTAAYGRIDVNTRNYRERHINESLVEYFRKTAVREEIINVEIGMCLYFLLDIIMRFLIAPNKFSFFTDTINWIEMVAILSTLLANIVYSNNLTGVKEAYLIIIKVPRIFLLFKISHGLKGGTEAFILTLRACINELALVFLVMIMFVSSFGVLIFVMELISESKENPSKFTSIHLGMWWALVTMATVGYGDFVPNSKAGYVVGWFCILLGVVIYQLPVPIFLKNFQIYYNQAQARIEHQSDLMAASIDPEMMTEPVNDKHTIPKKEVLLKMKRFTVAT